MKKILQIFILLIAVIVSVNSYAIDLKGVLNSHDPATLIKDGNVYWHFTTGMGIWSSTSKDLVTWSVSNKPVFPNGTFPAWVKSYVPAFDGNFWAPDIIYMNNAYYIYYSCSSWGTSKSAIGVAKSTSLNNPSWKDMGRVVSSSGSSTEINAIDPGIFRDDDGQVYMVYGSWFGGIGIVDIDSVSGTATSTVTHLYGGNNQSIEGAYLFKEGSYYYLVVNRGNCCQGVNSTYYITVGRSTNVKGPYDNFRNLLTSSGKYIGPGHFGLLREPCANYVSIHYYDGNANGTAKLDILKMKMVIGWPVLTRDFTFADCDTVGVDNLRYKNSYAVKLYPNPVTNGTLHLEIDPGCFNSNLIRISVYKTDGQPIYTTELEPAGIIDLETGLPTGNYLLNVQSAQTGYTLPFVVR